MALNFPVNPSNGQIYIGDNGITYVYNGGRWSGTTQGNITGQTDRMVAGAYNTVLDNTTGNLILPANLVINGSEIAVENGILYVNGNVVQGGSGNALTDGGYTVTLGDNGVLAFGNSRQTLTANDYDSPHLLAATYADTNWSYGFTYDGASNFWTQVAFYGVGDGSRGFKIKDNADGSSWTFDGAKVLTLPNGGKIGGLQYANGIDLFADGTMSYSQVNYDNRNYIYVDTNVSQLQTPNVNIIADDLHHRGQIQVANPDLSQTSTWTFNPSGNLALPDGISLTGTTFGNLQISQAQHQLSFGPGESYSFLYMKNDGSETRLANDNGNVRVSTSNQLTSKVYYWTFSNIGNLVLPSSGYLGNVWGDPSETTLSAAPGGYVAIANSTGDQYVDADDNVVQIGTNYRSGAGNTWYFQKDGAISIPGGIIFPDSSVQSTAYSNAAVSTYLSSPTLQTFGDSVTIVGNLTIQGNLFYNGNATTIDTNNLVINDNIIYLANANPANSMDIGLAANFNDGVYQHTGFVRQASTNTWKLFSNVISEPGLTVDFTTAKYDNIQVGNITSPTVDLLNANALAQQTTINVLLSNSASQQSEIYSLQSNASAQQSLISTLQSNAATQSDLIVGINANVTQANLGIIGYIDQGNTIQATAITNANLGIKGYVDNAVSTANIGIKGYIDQGNTIQSAQLVSANVGIIGYINQANTIMKAYVDGQISAANTNVSGSGSNYSNVNLIAYLGGVQSVHANIKLAPSGNIVFPDGTVQTTAAAGGGSNYGNGNVASYLITNGYVNTNSAYANANVTSYLPTHTGNVGVNNIIGTSPNVTLVANSYSTTFDIYGNVAFGNATYPVQIYATSSITTNSNVVIGGSAGVVMPNRPAFRVNGTALYGGAQSTANVNLKGVAVSTVFNQGGYFDSTTGKFTAPVAGIYQVELNARVGSLNSTCQLVVLKNGLNSAGNIVCFWEIGSTSGTANHFGVSGTVQLAVGDYLSANILLGNVTFDQNDNWCVTYLG